MIAFLLPHEDETFYSLLGRYWQRLRPPSVQSFMQHVFGKSTLHASSDVPSCLDHLGRALPPWYGLSTDLLVNRHTLFPYYSPFMTDAHALSLLQKIRSDRTDRKDGTFLRVRRGSVALPEWLRYCPVCADNERHSLGEPYWHRLHQLPGIEVCPVHEVWLESSTAPARALGAWHKFITADHVINETVPRPVSAHALRLQILQLRDRHRRIGGFQAIPAPV